MPTTIETTAYTFDELSDEAKERARDWYREARYNDASDFDCVIDDFVTIAEMIGVDFKTHEVKLHGGGIRQEPSIYWSGFCSQGDGACFEGVYRYAPEASAKVREYCSDEEVLRIADELTRIQTAQVLLGQPNIMCSIERSHSRYSHEHSVSIDTYNDDDNLYPDPDGVVADLMRDLMRWLYARLRDEDERLNSAECIDESIRANDYMFDEDGDRHACA